MNWLRANISLVGVFVCSLALLLLARTEASATEPKRVLLLHSFGHAFSPWSDIAASFRAELVKRSPEPVDLYEVSLDTARFREAGEDRPFVEYLRSLLAGRKLDLIVPMGAPAAFFFQRHRSQMFMSVPMLITGADQRRIAVGDLLATDTAVALTLNLPGYIENVLRLRPGTRNIAAVIGNSPVEKFWLGEIRAAAQLFSDRVNFIWLNDLSFDEILKQAADLPPQSALLYLLMAEDVRGVPYSQDRALEALRAIATVPIFGVGDYQMGRGIIGGPLLQSQTLGQKAADVALRILQGEPASSIKSEPVEFGSPIYDWRELRRWDISESLLPAGSIVQFREPSLWQRYRWHIIAITIALLTQTLLIAGLFYEQRRRRHAEVEAHRRMAELAHLNRSAAAGEMSASIAHEINQPLAAIVLSGNVALRWLTHATPDLEKASVALKRIISDGHRASQVITTVRAMFKKDEQKRIPVDLNAVIHEVLTFLHFELEENNVVVTTALTDGIPHVLGDRIQLQQVILNVVRNAIDAMSSVDDRDRFLRIRSEWSENGDAIILISDSGEGIDPAKLERIFEPFFTTKVKGMGMGLSICRSIIEDHGGRLSAAPGNSNGLVFEIVLPLPHQELVA